MTENTTYDQLRTQRHLSLEWRGINSTQICFEKSCFSFKKDHVTYAIEIAVIGNEKKISISVDTPTTFEKIYHYLGDIRRYEYLVDGAFYCMKKCKTYGIDVTNSITDVEIPYFFSGKYKHKIPLELTDKEYKRYFLKWLKLQSSLGIINQVALFANCLNGLTADVRISMLAECFEAFGKRLEKEKKIIVKSENNTTRTVQCENCKEKFELPIRGKKSFACYMTALIETYGKTIFSREYRRRKTLIQKIVKTRNKVFHVNAKQNGVLDGAQCGFYAIKLEWMFRYIIWLEMGFPKDKLDVVIKKEIKKFESQFPNLIY